jgi:hypothetical protein
VGAPAGLFTISGNQIKVASGASFDYETTPSYALTVRATDSTGNTFDQAVTINISNYAGSYTGTSGKDTVTGTSEEDFISGGAGNDTLDGGAGNGHTDRRSRRLIPSQAELVSIRQIIQLPQQASPCHSQPRMETVSVGNIRILQPEAIAATQMVIPSPALKLSPVPILQMSSVAAQLP